MKFTRTEVLHLTGSVLVLTAAFSFVLTTGPFPERLKVPFIHIVASFIAVSTGFVLHELAHKLVAQSYGFWAEFRAQFSGMIVSLAVAIGAGFLVAAPGAVLIWGRVTRKQNGIVSIVGPLTNLGIALVALPFTFQSDTESAGYVIAHAVAFVNSLLCVFNMLPVGPFDGRKVMHWNWPIWLVTLLAGLGLFIFMLL